MKVTRYLYWVSLLLIVLYAAIRAWKVTPLFDEAASFFHYFMSGNVWNDEAILDANNHLLISYWGHFWFKAGFDHFFFFRLISLIGFVGYLSAWHTLIINKLKLKWGYLIVICCVSVPWILEYGALARGYVFALACWFWMIILLIEIICELKFWKILIFYTLAWFAIFTSFTFTIPVFLLIGVLIVYIFFSLKKLTRRQVITFIIGTVIFAFAYYPLLEHSIMLKEGGFLWWGFRHGLWLVTGKSISKVVLFSNTAYIQIMLITLLVASAVLLILSLKKTKVQMWFRQPFHWITAYTLGILITLVVFEKLLGFNYPMDRVGMYLVPLFLLLVIFCFSFSDRAKWGNLLLLFFPASMLMHLNFTTTIYSPEDRISDETYKKINELIPSNAQLGTEWMSFVLFNYAGRIHDDPRIAYLHNDEIPRNTDYYLQTYCKRNQKIDGYHLIYLDSAASFGIFKKNILTPRSVFERKQWEELTFTIDNNLFFKVDSLSNWTNTSFSYQVKGEFELPEATDNLKFHVNCVDSTGRLIILQHNNLHHSFYPKKRFSFETQSNTFPAMSLKEVNFHIENFNQKEIVIKNLEVVLFQGNSDEE